jgi:hypothetical protein
VGRAGEIKTKTLQVGITLAWPLLGFVGFQKSEQLHATLRGLFSFLRRPSVDAFGTDEVTFITLLKGSWFLDILLSHKPFLLDRCPVSGSLVGVPCWLPVDGGEALGSAIQVRNQMCSNLSLVHESLQRFDLTFWCFGTVLRNLTAYQMIRIRWGASQVPVNARSRSSPYPIWGLKSFIGSSSLPLSFIFYPDYGPP